MAIVTYTVKEVAGLLRVGHLLVYRLLRSGKLQAIKVGKSWRITPESVAAYLAGVDRREEVER